MNKAVAQAYVKTAFLFESNIWKTKHMQDPAVVIKFENMASAAMHLRTRSIMSFQIQAILIFRFRFIYKINWSTWQAIEEGLGDSTDDDDFRPAMVVAYRGDATNQETLNTGK